MGNEYVCNESVVKKERTSGVELFRIIAMILICLSHAAQTFLNQPSEATPLAVCFFDVIFRFCGKGGNLIFIICSSYFLLDSNGVKGNKVIKMLLDSTLISVLMYAGFVIAGYKIPSQEVIKHFLPDLFGNMWFIPIYVLFYMLHPFLNAAVRGVDKRTLLSFCVVLTLFYGFGGLLFGWSLGMSNLARFIAVFFLVAYFKLYHSDFCDNKKANAIVFVVSLFLLASLTTLKYCFNLKYLTLEHYYSPVFFPLMFSAFNMLRCAKFCSKTVNYLASCSLFFYCIHENALSRGVLRVEYYKYVLPLCPEAYAGWVFLCFAIWLVAGYLLALIYKVSFSRITDFISKKLNVLWNKFIDFLSSKCNLSVFE